MNWEPDDIDREVGGWPKETREVFNSVLEWMALSRQPMAEARTLARDTVRALMARKGGPIKFLRRWPSSRKYSRALSLLPSDIWADEVEARFLLFGEKTIEPSD